MEGRTQGHYVGIMFAEFHGGGIFWKGISIHAEKIYRELAVDIVEFIFIFAVILSEVFLNHFFEIVEIIRAFGIDVLMDEKVFAFFFGKQSIAAVQATQFHRGEAAFLW